MAGLCGVRSQTQCLTNSRQEVCQLSQIQLRVVLTSTGLHAEYLLNGKWEIMANISYHQVPLNQAY